MHDADDLVISVDDHVIEPPDLWTSRLPAKYLGTCPQVREDDLGEAWYYDGKRVAVYGNVVQAGVPVEQFDPSPRRYSEIPPACYDPNERIKAMNEDGVLASLPFPNFPRFCGQEFYEARDRELGLLCVQAYNDFIVEEWAGVDPVRMLPLIIIPLWDPRLAATEIERCASKGAKAIAFSEYPPALGLPSIHDPGGYWEPVFATAAATGLPLAIHIGSSSTVPNTGPDAPKIVPSVLIGWGAATTCVDWLFSQAIVRHPELRISLAEGGIGWVPMVLSHCTRQIEHYQYFDKFEVKSSIIEGGATIVRRDAAVKQWAHDGKTVVDVFREHIRGCFIGGPHGEQRHAIETLGSDLFCAEVDFPHGDSSYPGSMKAVNEVLDGLPAEDQDRLRKANAIEWYRLDGDALRQRARELATA